MKIVFALSALLLLAAIPANAKGKKAAAPSMDTDGDGKVSLKEWTTAGKTETEFKELDKDSDGFLSKEELKGGAKKKKK